MGREQIKSILDLNKYLIQCKLENPNGYKAKIAQKYLTQKVSEILSKRQSKLNLIDSVK